MYNNVNKKKSHKEIVKTHTYEKKNKKANLLLTTKEYINTANYDEE